MLNSFSNLGITLNTAFLFPAHVDFCMALTFNHKTSENSTLERKDIFDRNVELSDAETVNCFMLEVGMLSDRCCCISPESLKYPATPQATL